MDRKSNRNHRLLIPWLTGIRGIVAFSATLYILLYLGWLTFHWGGIENQDLTGDLPQLPMSFILVIISLILVKNNHDVRTRRMYFIIGLGFLMYFLGNLSWVYQEFVLNVIPFPSISDIFYLLFAPLLTIGLLYIPEIPLKRRERMLYFLDIFIVLFTIAILQVYFVIQPIAEARAGDIVAQAISIAYPFMDIIMIIGVAGAVLRYSDKDIRSVIWGIFIGVIFFVASDIALVYSNLNGNYLTGGWTNAGKALALLFFILALLRQTYQYPLSDRESRWITILNSLRQNLPSITVLLIAITTIMIVLFDYKAHTNWIVGATMLIIILFVARLNIVSLTYGFRSRLIVIFISLAFIILFVTLTGSFFQYRQTSRSAYQQRLLDMVSIAALQQDGDAFQRISSENDEEYEQFRKQNLAIRRSSPDIVFVFTVRYDSEGLYFVVDAGEPGEEGIARYGERYEDPGPVLADYRGITSPVVEKDIYTDVFGSFLSAYAPIRTDSGEIVGIVGIDIEASTILLSERNYLLIFIGLFILTFPLIAVIGWILGNALGSPIKELAESMKISEGNIFYTPIHTEIPEIRLLDQSIAAMVQQLQTHVGNLETMVVDRTKMLLTSTELSRRISTILDQQQIVTSVVEEVQTAFHYYHVQIYLVDESGIFLKMVGGTGEAGKLMLKQGHKIRKGDGLVGRSAEFNQVVLVNDTLADSNWLPNPLLPETQSEIAVPISVGEQVLGILDVQQNEKNKLGQQDVDVLLSIASHVGVAVRNARQFEKAQKNATREAELAQMITGIQSTPSIEATLQFAAREIGRRTKAATTMVRLSTEFVHELANPVRSPDPTQPGKNNGQNSSTQALNE